MAQCLVQQEADMGRVDAYGIIPAFVTAQKCQLAMAYYFVQQGADKNKAANGGATPLIAPDARGHAAYL